VRAAGLDELDVGLIEPRFFLVVVAGHGGVTVLEPVAVCVVAGNLKWILPNHAGVQDARRVGTGPGDSGLRIGLHLPADFQKCHNKHLDLGRGGGGILTPKRRRPLSMNCFSLV
jgi:hypothetical protein